MTGYSKVDNQVNVSTLGIVLDKTSFYGQVSDFPNGPFAAVNGASAATNSAFASINGVCRVTSGLNTSPSAGSARVYVWREFDAAHSS